MKGSLGMSQWYKSLISVEMDQEIARLFKEGMSANIIGQTLGLTFNSVCQRIKRMRAAGMDLPGQFERKQKLCVGSKAELDPRRASILHLLDLKRAGHSPTQTELTITSERPLAARLYIHHGSLIGSSAAMCEAS
jgi:hypothetical protein